MPKNKKTLKRFYFIFFAVLSACDSISPPCTPAKADNIVYVVEGGWHVEIGIPVNELDENLQFYKDIFPGADTLMFGYGKRTFFTAVVHTPSEYLLGPFPGPAVIHVVGLRGAFSDAYPDKDVITLALPQDGSRALSEFIWQDLVKNASGEPEEIAASTNPVGLFYDAKSEYNPFHTCNTWSVEALHAAGLPISSAGVIFSGQAMSSIHALGRQQCLPTQ